MNVGANRFLCETVCFAYGNTIYAIELMQGQQTEFDYFPLYHRIVRTAELGDEARVAQALAQNAAQATETAVQTIAQIDERAPIETVSSSGGEDIRILDALEDANFEPVTVSQTAVTPVQGKVSSGFGVRIHPITGERSCHTGLDIAAPTGTPIAAAYSGTVLETGRTDGRGNYIRLQHSDTLQTMYCHLSQIDVQEGDAVEAGDTIGLVGSTGMSTGPHLHFEVWIDGVRCNPVYVLQ